MASKTRAEMIVAAERLLAERGLHATSFGGVIERTGAPRGSVYHYFPGGKDEIVECAVEYSTERMRGLLEPQRGQSASAIVEYYFHIWRELLLRFDFSVGCAVAAVTVATDSPHLRAAAAKSFESTCSLLADLLRVGGMPTTQAKSLAVLVSVAVEGAVILCRASMTTTHLDLIEQRLVVEAGSWETPT